MTPGPLPTCYHHHRRRRRLQHSVRQNTCTNTVHIETRKSAVAKTYQAGSKEHSVTVVPIALNNDAVRWLTQV